MTLRLCGPDDVPGGRVPEAEMSPGWVTAGHTVGGGRSAENIRIQGFPGKEFQFTLSRAIRVISSVLLFL